jgi:diguanylate cyclase (GGDEF)-like protein
MDLHALLQTQAVLLAILGAMVLLAHHTAGREKQSACIRWFFGACLSGALGLALEAERGYLPPLLSIVCGNLLVLLLLVLLTRSIAIATNASSKVIPHLLGIAIAVTGALAWYTFAKPDVTRRVMIACIAMAVLLTPAAVMLFRAKEATIRVPTRTLGSIIACFIASCLLGVVSILRGAHPSSGAGLSGTILIAACALSFLWVDVARARAELERQAMTDPLTGLLNRRAIEALASRELARAARKRSEITVLTIDVDRFKDINDRLGHAAGDAALLGIARTLSRTLRNTDLAARTGGDEFLVVLPEASAGVAQAIEQRIQDEVRALELRTPQGNAFEVSITIGAFRALPETGKSYADLVHASDLNLYQRKQSQREMDLPISSVPSESVQAIR